MNRRIITLLAMGAAGAVAFSVPGFAGPEFKNKYEDTASTQFCGEEADNDTVTYNGPLKMWPPNHKLQNVSVTATEGDGSGQVELTITPSATDVTGGDGGPKHDPDYTPGDTEGSPDIVRSGNPSATVNFWLRSERSGKGDGRTYTIDWEAVFEDKTCSSMSADNDPFVVTVPHDMRGGRDW